MRPEPTSIEDFIHEEVAKAAPAATKAGMTREFRAAGEDHYILAVADLGLSLSIDRLRREHGELIGELAVTCTLPGARVANENNVLSIGDLNLSSVRARSDRAKLLATRANIPNFDWPGLVEDFVQRVIATERTGQPAVDLRTLPRPNTADDSYQIEGLSLPRRHPSILFGDGGSCKSYIALYAAGRIAETGATVALFDWELDAGDHRDRLERLFPDGMPRILYARCERPLFYEADRLRRIVRDNQVQYAVYDSVAFACDGPPEAAEVAGRYLRATRQIGVGSLHVAHISKAEGADKKPFGSIFWHNGARCTWFAELAESTIGTDRLTVGVFNRKANLKRLLSPTGFSIEFDDEQTTICRTDVANDADLAAKMSVSQRMIALLRRGPLTVTQIAEELDIEANTITQTVNRYVKKDRVFIVLHGEGTGRKVGLRLQT